MKNHTKKIVRWFNQDIIGKINLQTIMAIICIAFLWPIIVFGVLMFFPKEELNIHQEDSTIQSENNPKLEWPLTTPPDTTEPYWNLNNNLNINGVNYYKKRTSDGKWKWTKNIEKNNRHEAIQNRKRELMQALQSRVLTADEMQEVNSYGRNLNLYPYEVFKSLEKQKELNEALLQQHRLRQATKDNK